MAGSSPLSRSRLLTAFLLVACSAPSSMPLGSSLRRARVTSITDGDTIRVTLTRSGSNEPIRLIGIDTPERGVRCFDEASSFTGRIAPVGSIVWLEMDEEIRDRYDRLLAYIWLDRPDDRTAASMLELMANAKIVNKGWGTAYPYEPNTRYENRFESLERRARNADRGIWGPSCRRTGGGGDGGGGGGGRCDPAYPDVCIPSPPPDLDCGDVRFRNFRVRAPDPHRFDGNHDGRGCES